MSSAIEPTVGAEIELWHKRERLAVGRLVALDDDSDQFIANAEDYATIEITETYDGRFPKGALKLRRPCRERPINAWERRRKHTTILRNIRLVEVFHA